MQLYCVSFYLLCVLVRGDQLEVNVQIDGVVSSFSASQLDAALAVSNMSVIAYNDQNVSLAQAQCPTGSYCPADSTTSIACAAGTYQPLLGQISSAACRQCPINTYCPFASTVVFTSCPSGFKCNAAALTAPIACELGTYQTLSNQSACVSCPTGARCPLLNMSLFSVCGLGNYQPLTGQTICLPCPAGSYCSSDITTTPTACSEGSYRGSEGGVSQAECTACPVGAICASASTSPTLCSAGSFNPFESKHECTSCSPGFICPVVGLSVATPCAGGSYRAASGGIVPEDCTTCPVGSYCASGVTAPTQCIAGMYNPFEGKHQCLLCPAGRYCFQNSTTPTLCDAGTFRSSESGSTQSDCSACPQGQYCVAGTVTPTTCALGFYQALSGHSACDACTPGHYCDAPLTPTSCAAGTFRADFGGASAADCAKCTLGTYDAVSVGRITDCAPCAAGGYCLTPTSTATCPSNTNSLAGSSSQLGCRCAAGYVCSYKKLISAVVTLNSTTVADFNNNVNGIKTTFIASVAAAAGVSSAQVIIISVQPFVAPVRRLLSDTSTMINVVTRIEGAQHMASLSQHMQRRGLLPPDHDEWSIAHSVRPQFIF